MTQIGIGGQKWDWSIFNKMHSKGILLAWKRVQKKGRLKSQIWPSVTVAKSHTIWQNLIRQSKSLWRQMKAWVLCFSFLQDLVQLIIWCGFIWFTILFATNSFHQLLIPSQSDLTDSCFEKCTVILLLCFFHFLLEVCGMIGFVLNQLWVVLATSFLNGTFQALLFFHCNCTTFQRWKMEQRKLLCKKKGAALSQVCLQNQNKLVFFISHDHLQECPNLNQQKGTNAEFWFDIHRHFLFIWLIAACKSSHNCCHLHHLHWPNFDILVFAISRDFPFNEFWADATEQWSWCWKIVSVMLLLCKQLIATTSSRIQSLDEMSTFRHYLLPPEFWLIRRCGRAKTKEVRGFSCS